MAEDLKVVAGSKDEQYKNLIPQVEALLSGEEDRVANMSNFVAALKEQFNFFWVGFYLVKGDELVLGPFQGPVACTRIKKGRGVCGTAWNEGRTILVPDVEKFPGHIACSSQSKSEIVIPVFRKEEIIGVLDVDSDKFNDFDDIDRNHLEKMVALINWE
jgi:L-methionine (R)-S-oxide reductase